jgi:hypothetical protein
MYKESISKILNTSNVGVSRLASASSPNMQARMGETLYRALSRGLRGGKVGLDNVLLLRRESLLSRYGRNCLTTSVIFGLTLLLGSLGSKDGPCLTDLGSKVRPLLVCCLVPLVDGSIVKKEVIARLETGLQGGWRIWEWNLRTSLMYKAKHPWLRYQKKLERLCDSLNRQWNCP